MKQIELELGGEKRTFYFGLGALGNLFEKENIQITDLQIKLAENYYKWCPLVMYHCLSYGYIRKNEYVPFDSFDVAEWIDELTEFDTQDVVVLNEKGEQETVEAKIPKVVKEFFIAFWRSITENVPQKEDKKKATKK